MKWRGKNCNKTSIHIKYAPTFEIAPNVYGMKNANLFCFALLCSRNVHFIRSKNRLQHFNHIQWFYYNCVTNSYHFFNTFSSSSSLNESIVIVLFGVWFEIWGSESAMWPVPSIQINWNGFSVSQMFYISHDCMLFYRTYTHTHTLQVKCSLLIQLENRRYCCMYGYTHNDCCSDRSKCTLCTLMLIHTFSNCVHVVIILFCFAYPCIVQAIRAFVDRLKSNDACWIERERKRRNRTGTCDTTMWVNKNTFFLSMFIDAGWLADWLPTRCACTLEPMLNWNALYVECMRTLLSLSIAALP